MKWLISILFLISSFALKAQTVQQKEISYVIVSQVTCKGKLVDFILKSDSCYNETNFFIFKKESIQHKNIHYPIYKNELDGGKIILYTGTPEHLKAVIVIKFIVGGNVTISTPIDDNGKEFIVQNFSIIAIKKNE